MPLRVPWTARRSNQSILREISPGCSLEGLMLKLKLQYFGHQCEELTHLKRPWCWERLRAGGEGDDRGWDGWMASPNQWTWAWVNSGSWWWMGRPGVLRFMGSQSDTTEWLNWTEYVSENHQLFLAHILGFLFHFAFWLCHVACGILVPRPGTEPRATAVKAPSPNHWTARAFPPNIFCLKMKHYHPLADRGHPAAYLWRPWTAAAPGTRRAETRSRL